jgi:hypothetical protein
MHTPQPEEADRDLLAIQVATAFVTADTGRILYVNDPDRAPGPRFYLAGCGSGNIIRIRHDVSESSARALMNLANDEPALSDPESTPVHLDDYIRILASEAPVVRSDSGLSWCVPHQLDYAHGAPLVCSGTPEGDRLFADLAERGMPEALVALGFVDAGEFWPPWCVALHDNEIASVAFAARLGAVGAAAGVASVPSYRGQGFAAAATAGWAAHPALREQALFYSTQRTNLSSQRVVARLGLCFLGASFALT